MSADRIGGKCPSCGDYSLRERIEYYLDNAGKSLYVSYRNECRSCGHESMGRFDIPVVIEK